MPICNRHFFIIYTLGYLISFVIQKTVVTYHRLLKVVVISHLPCMFLVQSTTLVHIKDTVFYFKLMWQMILTLNFSDQLLAPVADYIPNQ